MRMGERASQGKSLGSLAVVLCLSFALAHAVVVNSPTRLEAAVLASGVYSVRFARFELFAVSPTLVKALAGSSVVLLPHNEDWGGLIFSAGSRCELRVGEDFATANSEQFQWLLTLARGACLPFAIAGALFARAFARELFDSEWSGFCGLLLWCIEPNIFAHSALITNDVACSAFGLGATWLFWRWLKEPTWERAGIAGLMFGLAQLTKMSWLMLFGLWPLLWLLWLWLEPKRNCSNSGSLPSGASECGREGSSQMAEAAAIALPLGASWRTQLLATVRHAIGGAVCDEFGLCL